MDEKMGNMTSVSTSPRIPLTKLDLPGKAAMSIVATTMVTLSIVSVLQLIAGITCYYEGYKAMFSHMAPYMRFMAAQIQRQQPPAAIMEFPSTL
ncbi:hypothetical protein ACK1C0_002114 [Salmonella enterica]